MLRFGGQVLEASPAYKAAVARQKAKDAERAERLRLMAPVITVPPIPSEPSPETIIEEVARRAKISVADIHSHCKTQVIADARTDAIVAIRKAYPNMSCADIGKYINRGKHMVLSALLRAGVGANPRRIIDRAEVLRLVSMDYTPQQIADQLGFTVRTVLQASFQARNKTIKPERVEILERAMKLRAKGMSFAKMGKILNINPSVLQRDFIKMGVA